MPQRAKHAPERVVFHLHKKELEHRRTASSKSMYATLSCIMKSCMQKRSLVGLGCPGGTYDFL